MLYPTHQPFFIPFNSFTIPNPPPSTTTTTSPLPPSIQGMECVGALKSSFRPEMAVKKTQQQQAILDDLWMTVNAPNAVSGDDFSVDDLLDFSKGGIEDGFFEEQQQDQTKPSSLSVFTQHEQEPKTEKDRSSNFSAVDELSVPADDVADLEWLSHFVEESEEYSLTYPTGKLPEKTTEVRSDPPEIGALTEPPIFTTPVQTKAISKRVRTGSRSKRVRTGSRIWSLGSASLTESSSSSSTNSTSSSTLSSSPLIYTGPSQTADSLLWPLPVTVLKKQKKRKMEVSGGGGGGSQQPRRCSHCLVQKTPQWRTGPNGAKTLCNACGVRYKSGRLLPEYRPACSPTFSSEVHSNNHRKVLEMRRKKEGEAGLAPPVQSF